MATSATLALDLRQTVKSINWHPRGPGAPVGEVDRRLGLSLPLTGGAIGLASEGVIDDAAGAVEITFALRSTPAGWALLHAFGQYPPVVELDGDGLLLRVYHHSARVQVRWKLKTTYTLRLHWDHRAGVVLTLGTSRRDTVRLERAWSWQAFRQTFVVFSVGGLLGGRPVFSQWLSSFNGWVRGVRTWRCPLEVPPPQVTVAGTKSVLPRHPAVTILQLHDPPVIDSPVRCPTIPDRLADLHKTRAVWQLDALRAKFDDELKLIAALTHYLGHLWPHCHYWPWQRGQQRDIFWQPGHAMYEPIASGRMGGMCGGYAHVMEELAWSLGMDARRVQVLGHSGFEMWSSTLNKWVICEPSYNRIAHVVVDGAGNWLGVGDLIRRHEQLPYDGTALDDVRIAVCNADGTLRLESGEPHVGKYVHLGVGLGDPTVDQGNRPHAWYFLAHDRGAFRADDMNCGGPCTLVKRIDDLCWSCQRAQVALKWSQPGAVVAVDARPVHAAHHQAMQASVDGGDWRNLRPTWSWKLHPGVNELAVRTLNRLGATGHPWRLRLFRRP